MTPNAQHKRAERERRKAAGEVRVECWLTERDMRELRELAAGENITVGETIRQLLKYYLS